MPQNVYDDPDFFAAYSRLERSVAGLDAAPEWPALRALLPPLDGRTAIDLGCGFGWFCRWARAHGAARLLGIDISENMLGRARAATADAAIEYRCADLATLDLPAAAFDLAYSALVFHYVADLNPLLKTIRRALRPGGHLVCSMEHPIYMAPRHPDWRPDADGRRTWPLDSYQREGERITDWLAPGVVKYHRTMATTLNLLIRAGFAIRHVEEWSPTEAQVQARPQLAEEYERPTFLLLAAHI